MSIDEAPASRPRPVRAKADEPVETRLDVNGTEAVLRLPARVTLADALRDYLGLTGTHLGCEHGVCGMCTVLVDGQAARACLLFACQLDGAEVVTVEGLGSPGELHPLQEAFGRNHALQCGFCTPGFLMSSYDLLRHRPDVTEDELPVELSGVICRCTGYRNIVAAVAQTGRDHPDGIPGPGNLTRRVMVGRATGQAGGTPESAGAPRDDDGDEGPTRTREIVLPSGDPTIAVRIDSAIPVLVEKVRRVFDDVPLLARCLPGAELTGDLGDDRYAGRARVSVGPIKLSFKGVAHIVEHDRAAGILRVLAEGQDTGGARTQADIILSAESSPEGSILRADARVYLTGRIAQFGRALAGDVSRRMFEQFTEAVAEAAVSGQAPSEPAAAPSAVRLLAAMLRERLSRALRHIGRPH